MRKKRNSSNSLFKALFSSKIVVFIGFILLVLVSVALTKELMRKHNVNNEIEEVKKEIDRLERRNAELSSLIDYLRTDSFKEIQARQSLGMQKDGETSVAITEPVTPNTDIPEVPEINEKTLEAEGSNVSKWWNYFFKKR
ncbi:septum formation initiator family protein [Patescibacteria group bacterium]|nr:septum formation initiator family protein [Patescibacteria group bacterium]